MLHRGISCFPVRTEQQRRAWRTGRCGEGRNEQRQQQQQLKTDIESDCEQTKTREARSNIFNAILDKYGQIQTAQSVILQVLTYNGKQQEKFRSYTRYHCPSIVTARPVYSSWHPDRFPS